MPDFKHIKHILLYSRHPKEKIYNLCKRRNNILCICVNNQSVNSNLFLADKPLDYYYSEKFIEQGLPKTVLEVLRENPNVGPILISYSYEHGEYNNVIKISYEKIIQWIDIQFKLKS